MERAWAGSDHDKCNEPVGAQPNSAGDARSAGLAQRSKHSLLELQGELDSLVGLAPVKAEIRKFTNLIRANALRKERGLPITDASNHLVFVGNPGTGELAP